MDRQVLSSNRINLTKPPINTTCPLDNYVLFPTQNFFKQNEGG